MNDFSLEEICELEKELNGDIEQAIRIILELRKELKDIRVKINDTKAQKNSNG